MKSKKSSTLIFKIESENNAQLEISPPNGGEILWERVQTDDGSHFDRKVNHIFRFP